MAHLEAERVGLQRAEIEDDESRICTLIIQHERLCILFGFDEDLTASVLMPLLRPCTKIRW